ncbi:transposase [Anaerobacillus isosaccharinicus]|uniref:Transposase n=1 Tax=Anaerobacillus isosaccharinicus TaxID=1532552 RepID=A0A1S2L666_9BACI|nr:transposase [Anaerobacillus isosaccharinicus]MBA5584742.1 transposase [Anaerobacillus isosaccharinicus]QOY36889.1 transposase [Anaerobacillus isosaccharinicus]
MYNEAFGATAKCPILMFKLLLLKVMYQMSDSDLIERATFDMSFKYFLDVAPEDKIVHPTSLTKFRKLRLNDALLLDVVLIKKTVEIALEKGLIKSNQIIVDSTHTNSMFNSKSPVEILQEQSKQLRKSVYKQDETYKEKMPTKPNTNDLVDHFNYCTQLIEIFKNDEKLYIKDEVKLKAHLLEEVVNVDIEQLNSTVGKDAKVGHNSSDFSFFGYKTHIAMVPKRIITSAVVTTGEKHDGKQAKELIEKSIENGIEVKAFIGDGAYSEKNDRICKRERV